MRGNLFDWILKEESRSEQKMMHKSSINLLDRFLASRGEKTEIWLIWNIFEQK